MKTKKKFLIYFTLWTILIIGCSRSISKITNADPSQMLSIDESSCISCGKCFDVCPYNAIDISNDKPQIIQSKCTQCGECVAICPNDAIH